MRTKTFLPAAVALVCGVFTACNNAPFDRDDLVGTWKAVTGAEMENGTVVKEWEMTGNNTFTITYDADGSFSNEFYNPAGELQTGSGQWELDGDKLVVVFTNGDEKQVAVIEELTATKLIEVIKGNAIADMNSAHDLRLTFTKAEE